MLIVLPFLIFLSVCDWCLSSQRRTQIPFFLFKRLARNQEWSDSEQSLLLQCVLTGKAQEAGRLAFGWTCNYCLGKGHWKADWFVLLRAGLRHSLCLVLKTGRVRTVCRTGSLSAQLLPVSCRICWWMQDNLRLFT